jgi:putative hydrolase of the HAD superfamily
MTKAIIFDCFGVILTDALKAICNPLQKTNPEKAELITRIITENNRGLISAEASSDKIAKILGMKADELSQLIKDGEVKDQSVLDFIVSLRPNFKTAMLSNISSTGLEHRFTPDELKLYFDVVVASGQVGFAKPEAQAYEVTAEKLGVRLEECIMIDDVEAYCFGAKGVGMQAILYQTFDQMKKELEALLTVN